MFGGAGWVLFRKKPTAFEVFNDFNSLLVNLYRFVRDEPEALINALRYTLNSREDFNRIVDMFAKKVVMPDLEKAALFYEVIRLSYSSGCKSFACQPKNLWTDFPAIEAAHSRLRQTGVIIENRDFEKLIRLYDRPGSFFYLDPPYFGTEKMYRFANFSKESHTRLRDTLMDVRGLWLLSYNDCDFIRDLYGMEGIYIMPVSRLHNMRQRYDGGSEFPEVLIANYDLTERFKLYKPDEPVPVQTSLFGDTTWSA